MKTVHTTTIVGSCPAGCADFYEAEFHTEDRLVRVEEIQAEIDRAVERPCFQEDLTQRLADRLGIRVVTRGVHGKFRTTCEAVPKE